MSLTQVWGSLLIFILCPLLGGLPLIDWLVRYLAHRHLADIGTGNISVSAAFYHGGTFIGILAVISEASKGILAVLLARAFFPDGSPWELIALIALVMGRYWFAKGAGTTNVFWGMIAHDWQATLLTALIGGISFTIFRNRASGRIVILLLLGIILSIRHTVSGYAATAWTLVGLLIWIHQIIPDDLDLPEMEAKPESRRLFRFFRGDSGLISLNRPLDAPKVGQKAATLSQLKCWGYPIPDGWVLPPGDDAEPLINWLEPSPENPLVVRSSAIGEDSETASAAGQYATVLNVTSRAALREAILTCQTSYNLPAAVQYRQDREQEEIAMAVLIQQQIRGIFSGVAFSRDPVNSLNPAVIIEALAGEASRVVGGRVTPERFEIVPLSVTNGDNPPVVALIDDSQFQIQEVALLAREIEGRYHGVPQDIEWTYDGQQLWLLQARPVTNLQPIWTRKIAAEVIPGTIRPLTWSINRPLTCGVWGEIFTLVLGKQAADLDFNQTATLHFQHAYFNATLLGQIFLRMGLPPESLESLTRGAKFSKPPITATLLNLPGLWRLWRKESHLLRDFAEDNRRYFAPLLQQLAGQPVTDLAAEALLEQIEEILAVLKPATYYSILAPLSFALRQAITKVPPASFDNSETPEIASLRDLEKLAGQIRPLLSSAQLASLNRESLFAILRENSAGEVILAEFERWLDHYGYLGEVGTDIAVPRWREDSQPVEELLVQLILEGSSTKSNQQQIKPGKLQQRLNLKGRVTRVYSQLLAHLRWSFVALERIWLESGILEQPGDIFFLEFSEIEQLIRHPQAESKIPLRQSLSQILQQRRQEFEENRARLQIPYIIYGNTTTFTVMQTPTLNVSQQLSGIAASPGRVEGRVKVMKTFQGMADIDRNTILVVPYTDSGWAALLARVGGLIAEVGGSLSHGAIVAREYGIPAVMDVHHATELLRDNQRVIVDGALGIIEVLE